jgi:hypothetical protein
MLEIQVYNKYSDNDSISLFSIVYFVDIGGIVDQHCLSFLFINPFA